MKYIPFWEDGKLKSPKSNNEAICGPVNDLRQNVFKYVLTMGFYMLYMTPNRRNHVTTITTLTMTFAFNQCLELTLIKLFCYSLLLGILHLSLSWSRTFQCFINAIYLPILIFLLYIQKINMNVLYIIKIPTIKLKTSIKILIIPTPFLMHIWNERRSN